jgi:hypothetical protein
MKISPYNIYLEMQPNALLVRQNFIICKKWVLHLIPLPPKYRLPEFTMFNGSEWSSSIEHVSRYLARLGMISESDPLRVRFFSQSLTGPAFGWYTSLGPDLIRTWKQLEEQFHIQDHLDAAKAGIADLAQVRQKRGETVAEYIQRIREVKNQCYSTHITEEAVDWHPWVWQSRSRILASNWSSILWHTWFRS